MEWPLGEKDEMEDRLRIFLWLATGGGLGALLGGVFGGVVGAIHALAGRSTGTRFGRTIAHDLGRLAEEEPSAVRQGAITGAADGLLFLGLAGMVGGLAIAVIGKADLGHLGIVAGGSVLLVGLALLFGLMAQGITRRGIEGVLSLFVGGLLGSLVAGLLLGAEHCLIGTVPGLLVGLFLSYLTGRYAPIFYPPQLEKRPPSSPSDAETDITSSPHSAETDSTFRRPGSLEE
jgi:hypothetical protein